MVLVNISGSFKNCFNLEAIAGTAVAVTVQDT